MTDIDARLDNWRLCFKDRPRSFKTGSLEGNYKEPPITKEMLEELKGQVFEMPTKVKQAVDLNDALLVERAVIQLPHKHKMVIVVNYMYSYLLINHGFAKVCTTIGISRKAEVFDDYLKKSKLMVNNLLKK